MQNKNFDNIVKQWIDENFDNIIYMQNYKNAIGCPNFFFPMFNGFLFIDDSILHGHPETYIFKNDISLNKIVARNMAKDSIINDTIISSGFSLLRLWDFNIFNEEESIINKQKIIDFIFNGSKKNNKNERLRSAIPFYDIFNMALNRQEEGIKEYGESSFIQLDLFSEIEEEMLDIMIYAYLQIVKIRALKERSIINGNKNI